MNQITKEQSGKLIAHWRLMPTDKDTAAVRDIVTNAVRLFGMYAKIDIAVRPYECESLGHGRIEAVITIRNAYDSVRMWNGTLVKGMNRITICFDKCAGLFNLQDHYKRQKEENEIFATRNREVAMAEIDKLPWDGVAVSFSGRTNGKERQYRCRHFEIFEGRGHYGYGAVWADIAEEVAEYVGGIARELGYEGKAHISKQPNNPATQMCVA